MPLPPQAGSPAPHSTHAVVLATISFAVSFAAWGLIGGLAPIFAARYGLNASQTALLVAVPVLLGSLARLPMGMFALSAIVMIAGSRGSYALAGAVTATGLAATAVVAPWTRSGNRLRSSPVR